MKLLVAPPGYGKTTFLMNLALAAAKNKRRVWWVGLPNHRDYVYRLASNKGAVLGFEFLLQQQVYYRLLTRAVKLQPLLVGTGRIAMVADVLSKIQQSPASPGEARLFARAIAELKRYGLEPKHISSSDAEALRIKDVFKSYEREKREQNNSWDYDDFRQAALKLAESGEARAEADILIVDGFREIGLLDLKFYQALAKTPNFSKDGNLEVWLSLPREPTGLTATKVLDKPYPSKINRYKTANPVSEARWVLRSLKQDLAYGMNMLDISVILPQNRIKAFLAIADEYGIPLRDESPKGLAETIAGRLLIDLLEIPNSPSASKLLAINELLPLAKEAMKRKIAGINALESLAEELSLQELWREWLQILDLDDEKNTLEWANGLLGIVEKESLDKLDPEFNWEQFKKQALERAKEAGKLGKGANFRAWWAALLQDSYVFSPQTAGVSVLTHSRASGRRFKKTYLLAANEGNYSLNEAEDYFLPEEERVALENALLEKKLPKRFLGRDELLIEELLSCADEITISFPKADQSGPLVVDSSLIKNEDLVPYLPFVPAGSRLELNQSDNYKADLGKLELKPVSLEKLKNFEACPFRFWAEDIAKEEPNYPDWLRMLNQMRDLKKLNLQNIDNLKSDFPDYANWLNDHSEELLRLHYGKVVPANSEISAYLDAASQVGKTTFIYKFVGPDFAQKQDDAIAIAKKRWNEHWAAAYLLENYKDKIKSVRLFVWPVNAGKIELYKKTINFVWGKMKTTQAKAAQAHRLYQAGLLQPKPGFNCRECQAYDICREGER